MSWPEVKPCGWAPWLLFRDVAGMAWAVQHRLGGPVPAGKGIAMGPIQHPADVAALLLMKGTPLAL